MRLATTTSVEQTGLLASLLGAFQERTGVAVHCLAVGTGQALSLAERGDVDAVITHDPEAEEAFMAAGHGSVRRPLMRNDFVLVGPPGDPAGVRGGRDAVAALRAIAAKAVTFVSRGDLSGTHRAELRLWRAAGVTPAAPWYVEAGQGQVQALVMASERGGYCLTDRSSWLVARQKLALELLVEGDPLLANRYSAIVVNPVRHPGVRAAEATMLVDWLTSSDGQRLIEGFTRDGQRLFERAWLAGGLAGHRLSVPATAAVRP